MKIVALCKEGSCCPVVKITDSQVEIGENDNTCVLTIVEDHGISPLTTQKGHSNSPVRGPR
jgi:hypothetical protein